MGNKIVALITTENPPSSSHPDGPPPPPPGSTTRQVEASTGDALCVGVHAFRPHGDESGIVRLLACVGDELIMYGVPLKRRGEVRYTEKGDEVREEATLLGRVTAGKGYGTNVAAHTSVFEGGRIRHLVAVGCENGISVVYSLEEKSDGGEPSCKFVKVAECEGHTKAVCSITFHPRGNRLLTSAKDGTARVFDGQSGWAQSGVMECEIHDPSGPPPPKIDLSKIKTKDPRMMKRPPQILVRGCAYGDLEGRVIYTVASGKRGPAYLTRWRGIVPLSTVPSAGGPPPGGRETTPRPPVPTEYKSEYRLQCSPVPVSSASLSPDGALLSMGNVEGQLLLYDVEQRRIIKKYDGHDLPVTCVASRPVPTQLMLPGELEGGVSYDACSVSADNRMGLWTLQKRSRIRPPKRARGGRTPGVAERILWRTMRIPLLVAVTLVGVAVRDTASICREEFGLDSLVLEPGAAGRCVYREVLWAEDGRVNFVPE